MIYPLMNHPHDITSLRFNNDGDIIAETYCGGTISMGKMAAGPCIYGNCQARNICRMGHCLGINLMQHCYEIADGTLLRVVKH